ncbi:SIR2 family protein [Siculibacillus lacustris]|uniref:SIR2 family protein n=1 Tax=Siculibacillus lacustris TaxID=1549641 RepID=A0A4Q9VSU0_9HYPH|nr:SIR2 family protein [Siculibacillus lacustris]TBW38003.1 SIR2 family protein [Siculibacillus lacustris]
MTTLATRTEPLVLSGAAAEARLLEARAGLLADRLVPYLGPDLLAIAGTAPVPLLPETVAAALHAKAPAPARIRTNMWSVGQFIEQRRHRKTLIAYMAEIFAASPEATPLHAWLAGLPLSLVVDTWYDGAARAAFAATERGDWIEVQGVTRSGENRDIWTKVYDPAGAEVLPEAADGAKTVLYKPHGAVTPAKNFLIADSDYVEVLTEIDIQSPIPEVVKRLRTDRSFLFLGCRFHDQMLRTYARQIAKRSAGAHLGVVDLATAKKNELKFFAEMDATVLDLPLARAVEILVG